jgi:hypothetical protein
MPLSYVFLMIIGAVKTGLYLRPQIKFGQTAYILSDLETFGTRDGHKLY